MAVSNKMTFVKNVLNPGLSQPYLVKGLFQAGATQAIKRGEILERTAGGNTQWIPIDSDFAAVGNIAVAWEEIKSGDRAGYYWIAVPRPGDVWRYTLQSATAVTLGDALYYSTTDSQTLHTSGTNVLARVVDEDHYPQKQGHLADEPSGDAGTTIRSTSYALVGFIAAASYYETLFDETVA